MKKDDVLNKVGSERGRLLQAIEAFGERATSASVTDEGWTSKDVLGHLIHWLGQVVFGLGAQLEPPPYLTAVKGRPSGDEWNALAVDHYKGQSFDEVRSEFERLADTLVEQISFRTDDDMETKGTIAWAGDIPLWQVHCRGYLLALGATRGDNARAYGERQRRRNALHGLRPYTASMRI